jgi:uncharacterized protein
MTTRIEPGVIDANILIYAVNSDAPQHAASRILLEAALDPAAQLHVTSQILCEFYSVITNPRRIAVASSSSEAAQMILDLLDLPGLHVMAAPAQAVNGLMELLKRHPVTGGGVFDLQIVATMAVSGTCGCLSLSLPGRPDKTPGAETRPGTRKLYAVSSVTLIEASPEPDDPLTNSCYMSAAFSGRQTGSVLGAVKSRSIFLNDSPIAPQPPL